MEDSRERLQQLLAVVQPGVTPAMNTLLTAEFTTEESEGGSECNR